MTSLQHRPFQPKRIAWFMPLLLACALLLAQTLGLMHGVVHVPHGDGSRSGATVTLQSAHLQGEAQAHHGPWVDALFSSHHGDNDCRLFDQSSNGSAAPQVASLALPVLLPSFVVAIFQGEALARWAALFDARGPPLTL
ncbi:MAG: hypothetical protein V4614_18465 [Pseudomonadota bacterium]